MKKIKNFSRASFTLYSKKAVAYLTMTCGKNVIYMFHNSIGYQINRTCIIIYVIFTYRKISKFTGLEIKAKKKRKENHRIDLQIELILDLTINI